jgi:hypothetical protein
MAPRPSSSPCSAAGFAAIRHEASPWRAVSAECSARFSSERGPTVSLLVEPSSPVPVRPADHPNAARHEVHDRGPDRRRTCGRDGEGLESTPAHVVTVEDADPDRGLVEPTAVPGVQCTVKRGLRALPFS